VTPVVCALAPSPAEIRVAVDMDHLTDDVAYLHLRISQGTKPDTQIPNPKYLHLNPKNPNPQYPKSNSGSECYYPNLFQVNRVVYPGTRSTRTRNHPGSRRVIDSYYSAAQTANSVVAQPNESIRNLFSCRTFEPIGYHGLQYLLACCICIRDKTI
jgi:hypothetical protein